MWYSPSQRGPRGGVGRREMGKPSPGPQVQPGGAGEQRSGQPVSLSPEFTSGDGGRYAEKILQPAGVAQLTSGQGCTAVCLPGLQQGHACSEAQVCPHPACLCVAQQLQTHAHDTHTAQTDPPMATGTTVQTGCALPSKAGAQHRPRACGHLHCTDPGTHDPQPRRPAQCQGSVLVLLDGKANPGGQGLW